MRYRWKSLLVNLSLLLGSLALSLIFCEAILRLVAQNDSPLSMDIYQLDPYDQVSLKPNVTRRHFTREWNVTVAINSEGLRDRPSPVPDTRGRILALGDPAIADKLEGLRAAEREKKLAKDRDVRARFGC